MKAFKPTISFTACSSARDLAVVVFRHEDYLAWTNAQRLDRVQPARFRRLLTDSVASISI
jgi:hypothetical protein